MKPILFNTQMVRETLDDRKTATRMVANINPAIPCSYGEHEFVWDNFTGGQATGFVCRKCGFGVSRPHSKYPCGTSAFRPRYLPGDILYVPETWRVRNVLGDIARGDRTEEIEFKAGGDTVYIPAKDATPSFGAWHPSTHMPKEAARLFLRVTDVRVERLRDITVSGVEKEGIATVGQPGGDPFYTFKNLWNSTIKKAYLPFNGWDANPWVWVIEFERISKEEAQKGGA